MAHTLKGVEEKLAADPSYREPDQGDFGTNTYAPEAVTGVETVGFCSNAPAGPDFETSRLSLESWILSLWAIGTCVVTALCIIGAK